ncbi:MAG: hypothetical protein E3J56_13935 [Candidatus Aminicenantes bacterium]|nr:MAG: hypothetical protein E3J56_13935 [Candidatus Aminicenantes bacterium]
MKTFLGIDPGRHGAVAIITEGIQTEDIRIIDCPLTIAEMVAIVRPYAKNDFRIDSKAIIEKVNPFYKSSAKSAFTFGGNFFAWQAILACFLIPYDFITPRKWQGIMFDSAKRLDDTKQQSFERATRLFPDLDIELRTPRGKILDGRCDALLLAELLRRMDK